MSFLMSKNARTSAHHERTGGWLWIPLILSLLNVPNANAQPAPFWDWVETGGARTRCDLAGVVVTPDGGCIIAGEFTQDATFGNFTLIHDASQSLYVDDIFIVKYGTNGKALWAQKGGGAYDDTVLAIAVFPDGGCVIAGTFEQQATFGDVNLLPQPGLEKGGYLARYDSNGQVLWAVSTGVVFDFELELFLTTMADGSFAFTGSFTDIVSVGGRTFQSGGNRDLFVARYNADGTPMWALQGKSEQNDIPRGIISDDDGNTTVVLKTDSGMTLGRTQITPAEPMAGNICLASLTPDGQVAHSLIVASAQWGDRIFVPWDLVRLSDGGCIVTGRMDDAANFGDTELFNLDDASDMFFAKYTASGARQWIKQIPMTNNSNAEFTPLAPLTDGGFVFGGAFETGMRLDDIILEGGQNEDLFVARCDAVGKVLWAKQAGSTLFYDMDVATAPDGSGYLLGTLMGEVRFDSLVVPNPWPNEDVFVARYFAAEPPTPATPTPPTPGPTPTPGDGSLEDYYKILYKRDGKKDTEHILITADTIQIAPGGTDKDTLSIKLANRNQTEQPVLSLHVDGPMKKLFSEAPIHHLYVYDGLENATIRNAYVGTLEAGGLGKLNIVNNLPEPLGLELMLDLGETASVRVKPGIIQVIGQYVTDILAPNLETKKLSVASKKFSQRGSDDYLALGGVDADNIEATEIKTLMSKGGPIRADTALFACSSIKASGWSAKVEGHPIPLPADVRFYEFMNTASKAKIQVSGGNLAGGAPANPAHYLFAGQVTLLQAKTKKLAGDPFGGIIGSENASTPLDATGTLFLTGLDENKADIKKVEASETINALFYAGGVQNGVMWEPDYSGILKTMKVGKDGLMNGQIHMKAKGNLPKLLPKGKFEDQMEVTTN